MVKGRKVLQIICEVPLEEQGRVFEALGAPMPDAEAWVAIARLRDDAVQQQEPERTDQQLKPAKSLAQVAGIICNEPAFWRYVNVGNADEAADYVRGHCNVGSRAALDHNPGAAAAFRTLRTDYVLWLQGMDARDAA